MANYVFKCKKCKEVYEELSSWDETGKYKHIKCPHCKSGNKKRLVTACREVIFTNPRGTSKSDSFDYVAKYNIEQAKDLRRNAERKSHMGPTPYGN